MPSEHSVLSADDDAARRATWSERPRAVGDAIPRAASTVQDGTIVGFTADEQDYICRELVQCSSTLTGVAGGLRLRTWRNGLQVGRPKLPPAARSLVVRGLMRLDTAQAFPRLIFTDAGLEALRTMMRDPALLQKFGRLQGTR
jgi:hypothetical protein